MRSTVSRLLAIGVVAVIAVVGSLGGLALWDNVVAEDEPELEYPSLETLNSEAAKPKFEGELLGIFISSPAAEVPDKFVTYEEICAESTQTVQVPWDKAGEFDLSVELPPPFKLEPLSLNTGVIACGDTVYAARWDYSALQPNGYPGGLTIARSRFKYAQSVASSERVKTTEIGGLQAIYIEPLSENGIGSAAGVIFPGDSVTTEITSSGVPVTDLLEVAELIALEIDDVD